jgi:hypothetical protein
VSEMSIRCRGYFDEKLHQLSRLDAVMTDIESFTIETSEFELVRREDGRESLTFVAALFRETPDVGMEGWFVWKYLESNRDNLVYSLKVNSCKPPVYKHVLLWGSPADIQASAILSRSEARDLLSSLVAGKVDVRFDTCSFGSVVAIP